MSVPNVTTRSAAASKRGSLADITIHGDNISVNTVKTNNASITTNHQPTTNNINTPISSHIESKTVDPINNVTDTTNNNNVDALQLIARALQQLTNQSMQASIIGSPKPPTQSSNMVNNYNTSLADRAAVDDRSTMPALAKFESKIIKPDAFIEWKQKTTEAIDGHPRYSPLLLDVEQGWQTFIKANSKYTIDKIERFYLETQKSLWSLIIVCFDSDVITSITAEIKEEALIEPLPELLNFTSYIDPEFYKDCRKLLDKLSSRYEIKSGWSICDLIKRISSLQYRPNQEPIIYIELFHTLYRKLKLLNPKLSIPNEFLAYQMLGQLPVECQAVKMQFLNPTEPPAVEKVEEVLLSWWQSQQTNKPRDHNKDQHNKTPKSQEGKPKFRKQIEGDQKQTQFANAGTISPPTNKKNSNKKNFQDNNNNSTQPKTEEDHEFAAIDYPDEDHSESTDNNAAAVSSMHRVQPSRNQMAIDSGSTSHLTNRKDLLEDIHPIAPCRIVGLTGTCKVDSAGKLKLKNGVTLNSVKYVPNSPFNIASVSQIVNKGYQVIFTQEGAFIVKPKSIPDRFYKNPNNLVLKAKQEGNLFLTDLTEKHHPINAKYGDFTVNTDNNNNSNNETVASVASVNTDVTSITTAVASITPEEDNDDNTPITDIAAIAKPETVKVDIGIQTDIDVELNKDVDNLHFKLAHLGSNTLQLTNEHYELGISRKAIESHSNTKCTTCISCKAQRAPIGKKTANPSRKAENIMDCWHVDLIGPLSEVNKDGKRIHLPSLQGKIYILVIVDEYSRFVMVEPIQQKSDATESIINIIKQQQNATRLVLKRLHSDGGSEFNNKVLLDFLKKQGTEYTYTTPDTPELNGIAESTNKILTTMVRCMEEHGKLPLELWNYAYIHAAHIHNNVCQPTLQGGLVPTEIMFPKRKFNLDNIHTFGCDAHVLIENKRGKLQPKTNAGIYLGYHAQQHAHKILLIDSLRLQISRNVQFVEDSFTNADAVRKQVKESAEKASAVEDKEYEVEYISNHELRRGILYYLIHWKGYELPTWESEDKLTNCPEVIDKYNKQLLHINIALAAASVPKEIPRDANYPIPQSYKQAMAHPDKKLWEEAIQNELDSLAEFNTFTSCSLPTSRKAIDTRWVFAVKRNEFNKIIRWKARLVAKGFQQIFGVDYNETFSPAVKIKSLKLLLAIAAQQNLEIKQLDFNTAFLNAILNEDIYVKTPEGYYNQPNMVLKLNKALYGLKQAPREWWLELDRFLKSLGYNSSPIDECLYIKHVNNKTIYLPLYVDDTLAIYDKSIEDVWLADKKALSNKFSIKDIGDCEWILHMAVVRDRKNHTITLSQEAYIKNILEQHNLMDIKPVSTPHWHSDITIIPDKVEPELLNESDHHLYRSIVGSMLYAANITRLDISYVIGVLARYTHKPYNYHLAAAKHVLRYLRGTMDYKLTFGGNITNNDNNQLFSITMYTDSNWANEKDNRKSTGGWLTTINNLPINWQSKKQSTIAQSSTEAEYYALTEAINETRFLQQWFKFCCNLDVDIPIVIKCDNTGAIHMSDHSTNHNRTKHIDIKHFYIRDIIKQYPIRIEYISTKDQLADILTKATTTQVFKGLIDKLYH